MVGFSILVKPCETEQCILIQMLSPVHMFQCIAIQEAQTQHALEKDALGSDHI